jgi:hypothetical protein
MLDFLTAHVRYDLAVALLRTGTTDEHKHDYTQKINGILTQVASNIIDKYAEYPPPIRRYKVDKLGMKLALRELFNARDEAWDTFKRMGRAGDSVDYVQIRQDQKRRTEQRIISGKRYAGRVIRWATRVPMEKWEGEDNLVIDLSQWRRKDIMRRAEVGRLTVGNVARIA